MFYNILMNSFEKLSLMGQYMHFEPAEEVGNPSSEPVPGLPACPPPRGQPLEHPKRDPLKSGACTPADLPIEHAHLPGGKTMPLLKTLLTSACERNCYYCAFRSGP